MLSVALGLAWYVHRAYTWSSSGCAVLLLPLCKNPLSSISLDIVLLNIRINLTYQTLKVLPFKAAKMASDGRRQITRCVMPTHICFSISRMQRTANSCTL